MRAIMKREIRNYMKRPLFWIGILLVVLGVFQALNPYLSISYVTEQELPKTDTEGDITDGYVPSSEEQKRAYWEEKMLKSLISDQKIDKAEAEAAIDKTKGMDIAEACKYMEKEYHYLGAMNVYEIEAAYHLGTAAEINSYIKESVEEKSFSWYFSRKFADFTGLLMGFFATVMLAVLYMQDTRKNTYELLHTKPVNAGKYVLGKTAGGFAMCLIVLAVLNLVFWIICSISVRNSGFEVNLMDFIISTCLYVLPNMLMIVCIYGLISLIFKNPLPAVPLLVLYIVYSNLGSRNAEGIYGYFGRPLAIMVRFPGPFFDIAPPPMALLNQSFLILAAIGIITITIQLWRRRRI